MAKPRMGLAAVLLLVLLAEACATWPEGLTEPSRKLVVGGGGLLRTYDNGLVLFVAPDPRTSLVQLDMRQRVGGRDDPPGKAGLAHFVEHLMFLLPTTGPGSPTIAAELTTHALAFNATTTFDETDYTQTGTADELETFIRHVALRLGAECGAIDEVSFAREREVVRIEHAWRRESVMPLLRHDVLSQAFPEGHPYRRNPIPDETEFSTIARDDVCAFMERYYTAGQASIVITGNVDPQAVAALVERYLARLPNITVQPREPVPTAALTARRVEIAAPVRRATTLVLFELPPRFTRDHAAARVAGEMLLAFALLGQAIEGEGALASLVDIYPVELGGKASTLYGFAIETKRAADLDEATRRALAAIGTGFGLSFGGSAFREVYDVARQRARLELLDAVASIEDRGHAYSDYLEEGDDPGFVGKALATIDGLSGNVVQQAGAHYFSKERALVVEVVPGGPAEQIRLERASFDFPPVLDEVFATESPADAEEATRPLPFSPIEPDTRNIRALKLDNGMTVLLARSTEVPILELRLVLAAGQQDAAHAPEIAGLAAELYGPRDDALAQDVVRSFELAGASMAYVVEGDTTTFATRGLAIYLDHLVAGLAEHVIEARYRRGSFEQWQQRTITDLAPAAGRRDVARHNVVFAALYGTDHPLARPLSARSEQIKAMSRFDVEDFRNEHYRAANATLVVTGGFDLDLATRHIEGHFGAGKRRGVAARWGAPGFEAAVPEPPTPRPGPVRVFTEIDDQRAQTELTVMFPLAEVLGVDHAALAIAVEMADAAVGRVRDELGASYGIDARLDLERPRIEIHGFVDSARAVAGFAAVRDALASIRAGDEFDRRFVAARRAVVRRILDAQGDPRMHAEQLAEAVRRDRRLDYFDHLPGFVAKTTPAEVRAQIDRVLAPDRGVTLVQGPARAVAALRIEIGEAAHRELPRVDDGR